MKRVYWTAAGQRFETRKEALDYLASIPKEDNEVRVVTEVTELGEKEVQKQFEMQRFRDWLQGLEEEEQLI